VICVTWVLCVSNELFAADKQAEQKRGQCRDQADAKPYHVLGILTEMMFWQRTAQQCAEENAAQRQHENQT
jgi:hypothetical protein